MILKKIFKNLTVSYEFDLYDLEDKLFNGIIAGINLGRLLKGEKPLELPAESMTGALSAHVSTETKRFQPMGANMGILPPLDTSIKDKQLKYDAVAGRGLAALKQALNEQNFSV